MAVPTNLVQLAFAAGLDESFNDEVLDPMGAFPVLQNVRQDRRGGLSKRLGFGAITRNRLDATTRSAGNKLICHRDMVCTIDGTYLDAYAPTQTVAASSGRVPEAFASSRTLTATSDILLDVAYAGGCIATMSIRDNSTTFDTMVSLETTAGVVLKSPAVLATATGQNANGALATYGAYIIAFSLREGSANIAAWYLDTTSAATITTGWVSMGNVVTDKTTAGTRAPFQIVSQSLTNRVAIAYVNNSGGASRLTVATFTIAGLTESTTIGTTSVRPDNLALAGSIADTLWVAWHESTSIKVLGLDADVLATTLATVATLITTATAPTSGIFLVPSSTAGAGRVAVHDGTDYYFLCRDFTTAAGACTAGAATTTLYDVNLAALPVNVGGRYYGLFRSGDDDTSVLCDWTDCTTTTTPWVRPVALAFPSLTQRPNTIPAGHAISFSSTSFAYATPVARSSVGDSVELITYDLATRKRWRTTSHAGSLYLSAGILAYWDGRRVAEASFMHAPRKPVATDSGGGSGLNGTYRYVATYEDVDDDGNWCVSGVSDPSDLLTIVTNDATVTLSPLVVTNRLTSSAASVDKRMRVALYRTATGGEAPYYYVTSLENNTAAPLTYTDNKSDATIAVNRLLYGTGNLPGTNGAAQDRRAPPFCQDVVSYNGMLVVASGSDLWWSGQVVSGEGVWFSPAFALTVDGPGDVVGLCALDGTLYVFKRRSVYACGGEAPSDNGASGGLGTPRRLAADVGCIDVNSIVATSMGVFFQSDRGIELLSRSGAVTLIGDKVQDTLDSYPVISSAVLDDRNGLVRFSLAATESGGRVSGSGRDLVFDLTLGGWQSVDTKTGASSNEASQDAAMVLYTDTGESSAGIWRYAWMGVDGIVYFERTTASASAYVDGSTWITMAAETAWFKTGGIQGKQALNRVMVMTRKATNHDLIVSLSYNHETSFRTARQWTLTEINALLTSGWPITQLKHDAHDDGECQAFRIRIEDTYVAVGDSSRGSGKGATWIALTMDVTPKPGAFELPEEAA